MFKKLLSIILFFSFISPAFAGNHPFIFGLKIQDNLADNALAIEQAYNLHIPVVGLFFDDFSDREYALLSDAVEKLGTDKVYHLTVNPLGYTAKELFQDPEAKGFKKKYEELFKFIKEKNIKVIYRFCHEMNGGWYSWASDDTYYPLMWKRVWGWSRDAKLDQKNILFDYSVNSQDLPRVGSEMPTQESVVIPCNQTRRANNECLTFEDYYPGDEYVDVMGITAYNWGLGARKESWAYWRPFATTVDEPGYETFSRLKKYGKPLYIDEAGTTSVYYTGSYDPEAAKQMYDDYHTGTAEHPASGNPKKNDWILSVRDFVKTEPVMGGSYFNVDITYGLRDRSHIGELDWTIVDAQRHFIYPALRDILSDPDLIQNPTILFDMDIGSGKIIPENNFDNFVTTVRRTIGFPLGDQLFDAPYSWGNRQAKYQRYAERELKKHPELCLQIQKSFPELTCPKIQSSVTSPMEQKIFTLFLSKDYTKEEKTKILSTLKRKLTNDNLAKQYVEKMEKNYYMN